MSTPSEQTEGSSTILGSQDIALLVEQPLPPSSIVIFGATGDLTHRKLMPSLFSIEAQSLIPDGTRIIAFARREFTDESYRTSIGDSIQKFAPEIWNLFKDHWDKFAQRILFHRSDFDSDEGFADLRKRLEQVEETGCTNCNRLYYLATPPSTYSQIIQQLAKSGLSDRTDRKGFVRIIVEKPFGSDLDTARALNKELKSVFEESQIYRIDHYLGKETVQNIFVFRFANAIFEPIWNQKYVDNIQITVAETVGVETRAGYFDHAGELRDMVQSHAMQLLTLVAMEPPVSLEADAIRDEKVKVLKSLRPIPSEGVGEYSIRAQYTAGVAGTEAVPGYLDEPGVAANSKTDTFTALRLFVDNWRWAGVPFFIRAGKRMANRLTEINIEFKNIPEILFARKAFTGVTSNVLTIRIQPNEGISMRLGAKPPGQKLRVEPVDLDFTYGTTFGLRLHDAYERLLMDAMLGDASLFTRDDEVEAEWSFITPILCGWSEQSDVPVDTYPAGSWGPGSSCDMISKDDPRRLWWNR